MTVYTHEQVLDGARAVWVEGDTVAVWHGGRTLNLYVDAGDGDGWRSGSTHQFMEQPSLDEVAEAARDALGPQEVDR